MKIEYVYGCTCDSLTIDGVETVNMDIKDVRDCVLNIISKTNDLSLLQSILSDVAELDGDYKDLGHCDQCGDFICKYTLEI